MPVKQHKISIREDVGVRTEISKATMTEYPIMSRPVLTTVSGAESTAITTRLLSKIKLRKKSPNADDVINTIKEVFFRKDADKLIERYMNNPIIFDGQKILDWIKGRPNAPEKLK